MRSSEDRSSDRPTTKLTSNQIIRLDIGSSHIPTCCHFCEVVRDFDLAQQREVFLGFNEDDLFKERYGYTFIDLRNSLAKRFFDFLVENDFVRPIEISFKNVIL